MMPLQIPVVSLFVCVMLLSCFWLFCIICVLSVSISGCFTCLYLYSLCVS